MIFIFIHNLYWFMLNKIIKSLKIIGYLLEDEFVSLDLLRKDSNEVILTG